MSGHTVKMLMAIRLGRTGNLTGTDAICLVHSRAARRTRPRPCCTSHRLYVLTDSGS